MQLTQLEYLIAVEKYGSISRAAREMYTSQSSISTSIKTLEKELGVELLRRGPKGVQITAEGQYILENAKIIDKHIGNIRTVQKELDGKVRGNITVGGLGTCCMHILGNTAVYLKNRYPDIQVSLKGFNPNQLVQEFTEDSIDMGLMQVNQFNEKYLLAKAEYDQISCRELLRSHLVVAVNPQHPLYGRKEVTLEDLMPYEISTGFVRAENLVYWSLFNKMKELGYSQTITCLGDMLVSRLYAIKRNCIQLVPLISLELTNWLFSIPLHPIEIDQRYDLKFLLVYREETLDQIQELFVKELEHYLEPYQETE